MLKIIKLKLQIIQLKLRVLLLKEKLTIPNLPKPKYAVVHHGAGPLNFEQVNEYHKQKWGFKSSLGFYMGYHKFIEYDGKLRIARRDNERGAHTVEKGNPNWWNLNSVGICLQGNFEIEEPTEAQLETLERELEKYEVVKLHNEISPTLCPGRNLIKEIQ